MLHNGVPSALDVSRTVIYSRILLGANELDNSKIAFINVQVEYKVGLLKIGLFIECWEVQQAYLTEHYRTFVCKLKVYNLG